MEVHSLPYTDVVYNTAPSNNAQIAYYIMVHRLPEQFKRLFKAIYHTENYYLIHIDKKVEGGVSEDINQFLSDYPNASIIESSNVDWGGYSMVQAELNGMNHLLELGIQWDFFINLSGQDYPLKSQEYIQQFLGENKKWNYIKVLNQEFDRPETMNRIKYYFLENDISQTGMTYRRRYMSDTTAYIGGQWMILSRSCCEFICNSPEVKKFEDYYINTLIPDESFFQTVLMNTSFDETIVNDDKRAIIWVPEGRIKLRPKTFTHEDLTFLLNSSDLFARKFDDSVDADVVNELELRNSMCSLEGVNIKEEMLLTAAHN